MRCYYYWDDKTNQKILISHCYGTLHSNDIGDCTCPKRQQSPAQFEKQEYNKTVKELRDQLNCLQNDYDKLIAIIEKLTHKDEQSTKL